MPRNIAPRVVDHDDSQADVDVDINPHQDAPSVDDDEGSVSDSISFAEAMPYFRDDAVSTDSVYDDAVEQVPDSLKASFSRDRINPILLYAGRVAGAEFIPEDKRESSLLFGKVGMGSRKIDPVVSMPPDIYNIQDDVRSKKRGALGKSIFFNQTFRVPETDFVQLFKAPDMDADAVEFVKPQNKQTQSTFLPQLEKNLFAMDRELRTLVRMSSFQLLILNALAIQLSEEGEDSAPDGPFATAQFAAELASQQIQQSMIISHNTLLCRRENVYAGVSSKYKSDLVSRLKKIKLDGQLLFAGEFTSKFKEVARRIKRDQTLGKTFQAFPNNATGKGKSKGSSSSSFSYSNSRSHPYSGKGRGRGSGNQQGNQQGNSGNSSHKRGGRQNNRGQARGRGRGGSGSRF